MVSVNDQIEGMIDRLYFEMDDLMQSEVSKYAQATQRKLKKANGEFFSTLADLIIDSVDVPNFGPYSAPWTSLSFKYLLWKRKHGYSANFFRAYNDLSAQLRYLDHSDILGSPEVTVTGGAATGSKEVILVIDRNGNPRARNVSTGRFAKLADVYRRIPRALSTTAFPNIQDKLDGISLTSRTGAIEAIIFASAPDIMHKLAGRALQGRKSAGFKDGPNSASTSYRIGVLRPVIGPFLQWWFDTKIRSIVEGT